jgi:hypothetical protein
MPCKCKMQHGGLCGPPTRTAVPRLFRFVSFLPAHEIHALCAPDRHPPACSTKTPPSTAAVASARPDPASALPHHSQLHPTHTTPLHAFGRRVVGPFFSSLFPCFLGAAFGASPAWWLGIAFAVLLGTLAWRYLANGHGNTEVTIPSCGVSGVNHLHTFMVFFFFFCRFGLIHEQSCFFFAPCFFFSLAVLPAPIACL